MKNRKNLLGVLLLTLVLVSVFGIITVGCKSAAAINFQENPSIESNGTGFFVSSDGYIVTCAHVIEDASTIGVWVGENGYRAELVTINRDADVAILKINHKPSYFFRFANFDSAYISGRIGVLGFPLTHILGSEIRYTEGTISTIGIGQNQTNFQISAPVQPGNSGGPVFNEKFEVLGIVESRLKDEQNVNFAVKNTYITSLLPSDVRTTRGNVRSEQDAVRATVQISIDDIYDGPRISIVNNTGNNIGRVYISPSEYSGWGKNRLRRNQLLSNGESIGLNLTRPLSFGNRYDFRVEDANGSVYQRMNLVVTANDSIVFTPTNIAQAAQAQTAPTGTYTYGTNDSITFSGNNYTLRITDNTFTGSFSVSGNTFTLQGHNSGADWIRLPWTIVDSNTIRDADGDLWRKQETTTLSGTYYFNSGTYFTFHDGNTCSLTANNETVSTTYRVSGDSVIFADTITWTIVNSNTLRDTDGDLWERR